MPSDSSATSSIPKAYVPSASTLSSSNPYSQSPTYSYASTSSVTPTQTSESSTTNIVSVQALVHNMTSMANNNATSKPITLQNVTLNHMQSNPTLTPNVTLNGTLPDLPLSSNITLQTLSLNITALPKVAPLMNTTTTTPNAANMTANTTTIYPNLANITASSPNITLQMSSPKMPMIVPSSKTQNMPSTNATIANEPIKQILLNSTPSSSQHSTSHHHKKPNLSQSSSMTRHVKRNKKNSVKSSLSAAHKHHKRHHHSGHRKSPKKPSKPSLASSSNHQHRQHNGHRKPPKKPSKPSLESASGHQHRQHKGHRKPPKKPTKPSLASSSGHQHRKPQPHSHKTQRHKPKRLLAHSPKLSTSSSSSTSSKSTSPESRRKASVHTQEGRKTLHKPLKHEPSKNLPLPNITIQNNLLQKMALTTKLPDHIPPKRVQSPKPPKRIHKTSFNPSPYIPSKRKLLKHEPSKNLPLQNITIQNNLLQNHTPSKPVHLPMLPKGILKKSLSNNTAQHIPPKLNAMNMTLYNVHAPNMTDHIPLLKLQSQNTSSTSSSSSSSSPSSSSDSSTSSKASVKQHQVVALHKSGTQNLAVPSENILTMQHLSSNTTSPSNVTIYHTPSANSHLPNITYALLQPNKLNVSSQHLGEPNITPKKNSPEKQMASEDITTQQINATIPTQHLSTKQVTSKASTFTNITTKHINLRTLSRENQIPLANITAQHSNETMPNLETSMKQIANGASGNTTIKYVSIQQNLQNYTLQHIPAPNTTVEVPLVANIMHQPTKTTMPLESTQNNNHSPSIPNNTTMKHAGLQMASADITTQQTNATIPTQHTSTKQVTSKAMKHAVLQPNKLNNTLLHPLSPNSTAQMTSAKMPIHPTQPENITIHKTNTTIPHQHAQTNSTAPLLNTTTEYLPLQLNSMNHSLTYILSPNITTQMVSPKISVYPKPSTNRTNQLTNATMPHQSIPIKPITSHASSIQTLVHLHKERRHVLQWQQKQNVVPKQMEPTAEGQQKQNALPKQMARQSSKYKKYQKASQNSSSSTSSSPSTSTSSSSTKKTVLRVQHLNPMPHRRPYKYVPFDNQNTQQVGHKHTSLHKENPNPMYKRLRQLPNTTLHLTSFGSAMPNMGAQKAIFKLSISPENEPFLNATKQLPREQVTLNVTLPHIPAPNITLQTSPRHNLPPKQLPLKQHAFANRASSEQTLDLHQIQSHKHEHIMPLKPKHLSYPQKQQIEQHQKVRRTKLMNVTVVQHIQQPEQNGKAAAPGTIVKTVYSLELVKNPAPLQTNMGRCVNVSNRSGHSGSFVATG